MIRAAVAAVAAIAFVLGGTVATSSAAASAPTPVVTGNHLVDSRTGAVWTPHGVNYPSFGYACYQGWGYSSDDATNASAAAMQSWHIDAVRIPLNQDCWLGLEGSPSGPGETKQGYRDAVAAWVSILNAHGIVAILDLHDNAPAGYAAGDGQRAMADAQSTGFWTSVASAYSTNPSVMFDLFNEPYSRYDEAKKKYAFTMTWTCWKSGGCSAPVEPDTDDSLSGATYTTVGMDALVSAVRATGAAQPLLLGGIDYSNDLTGWLSHRPDDSQLVASWHNYPGQRCQTIDCWNAEIAPVAAHVPVMATEFGETDGDTGFFSGFMTWANAAGIGYSPWAWWNVPGTDSTNGLYALYSGAFQPKAPTGTTYHDHLAALAATTPSSPPSGSPIPTGASESFPPAVPSAESSGTPAASGPPAVLDRRPTGRLHASVIHGRLRVTGWAIDRDATSGVRVTVRIDHRVRRVTIARHAVPATPARYHSLGSKHGYTIVVHVPRAGKHRVCAWATDIGGTLPKASLGCVSVRTH